MAFAADAVTDVLAPPPARATPAKAADDDGPSFAAHLDAHDDVRAARANRNHRTEAQSKPSAAASDSDDSAQTEAASDDDTDAQADASTGSSDTHGPLILQLVTPPPNAASKAAAIIKGPAMGLVDAAAEAETAAETKPAQAKTAKPTAQTSVHGKPVIMRAAKPGQDKAATTEAAATQNTDTPTVEAAPIAPQPAQTGPTLGASTQDQAALTIDPSAARTAPQHAPHGENTPTPAPDPKSADAQAAPSPATAAATPAAQKAAAAVKAAAAAAPDFKDILKAAGPTARTADAASAAAQAGAAAPQQSTSETQQTALDQSAVRAAPVAAQVGREIVRRANGDSTRFELRLDPPELGKIQVRLDVSRDHKVTAVVSAENPQALSELSRGARDLQQALQSAGLDLSDEGLRFDLSNQGSGFAQPDQSNNSGNQNNGAARNAAAETQNPADTSTPRARLSLESWRGARLDVMA